MKTYAGYYKNEIREVSSSGGLFSALASYVLGKNGVVYGVCMSEDNYSSHFERASDEVVLRKMLSSKYMQAKIGNTFKNVKTDLDRGQIVLFSGTICQINGLKCYLQKDYVNLYCVDVICHGVPSHKLWEKYLLYRENQIGKCNELNFRSKDQGWYDSGIKENKIFTPQKDNLYMNLFLRDVCLRPSCYECICKKEKLSDFTLGDLWGVKEVAPELNDDRGLSVIFVRTKIAEELFSQVMDELILKEITYEQAVLDNSSEYASVSRPIARNRFYKDMRYMEFSKLADKYLESNFYWNIMERAKRGINRLLKIKKRD